MTTAILYVVSTPIGNMGDLSPRAVDTLKKVDVIAAEDTRHSGRLLQHFGICTPMIAVHDHNERQRLQLLLEKLAQGQSIALISDAGRPRTCLRTLLSQCAKPSVSSSMENAAPIVRQLVAGRRDRKLQYINKILI